MQGLPPSREPGRAGMMPQMLMQLLQNDVQERDIPYSPGQPQAMMQNMQEGQPGTLPNMDIGALLASSAQARESGDLESMRGLRRIIEGRSSDDIARGPKGAGQGLTSAEPITQRMSPRQRLLDALGGSLNPHQQQKGPYE